VKLLFKKYSFQLGFFLTVVSVLVALVGSLLGKLDIHIIPLLMLFALMGLFELFYAVFLTIKDLQNKLKSKPDVDVTQY
jgi:hypothetical protein